MSGIEPSTPGVVRRCGHASGVVNSERLGAVREGGCVTIVEGLRRGGIDARESDDPGNDAGLGMAFTAQ